MKSKIILRETRVKTFFTPSSLILTLLFPFDEIELGKGNMIKRTTKDEEGSTTRWREMKISTEYIFAGHP
jgi:hypothetical protein